MSRFISEPITPEWDNPPLLEKTPRCPDRFVWRDETWVIAELLQAWQDTGRRGRMAQNMRPERLERAKRIGSWGVGRFFYRVRVANGRVFDIYYDRAPKGSDQRKGSWLLFQELAEGEL